MGLTGCGESERQKTRGCTSLQINSARLKAFIREKATKGGKRLLGLLLTEKGRNLTSRSSLKKHMVQHCVVFIYLASGGR